MRSEHILFLIFTTLPFILGADMKDVSDQIEIYNVTTNKVAKVDRVVKSDAEWRKILTAEQYQITRQKGTEPAFGRSCAIPKSGKGVYQCVGHGVGP